MRSNRSLLPGSSAFSSPLGAFFGLTADEQEVISGLRAKVEAVPAQTDLIYEREYPTSCILVLDGFVARYKDSPVGGRQILSLHIRGDMANLCSLHLKVMDCSIQTLSDSTVAFFPVAALKAAADLHRGIADAIERHMLIDAAISRQWLDNVGSRDAPARLAHLLCEMALRCRAAGLCADHHFPLPLKDSGLGEALALSNSHARATLQMLHRAGLIGIDAECVRVKNWDALKHLAGMDTHYLYLDDEIETAWA